MHFPQVDFFLFLVTVLVIATGPTAGATTGLITRVGVAIQSVSMLGETVGPLAESGAAAGTLSLELNGLLYCLHIQKYSLPLEDAE